MNEKRYPIYMVWGIAAVWLLSRLILCFTEYSAFDPILTLLFCGGPPCAAAACHWAMRKHRAFLIAMPWTTLAVNPLNWLVLFGGAVMLVLALGNFDDAEDWLQAVPLLGLYVSYLLTHGATALAVFLSPRRRIVATWLFLAAVALEIYPMYAFAELTEGNVVILYPDFLFPNLLGAFVAWRLSKEQPKTENAPMEESPIETGDIAPTPEDPLVTEVRQAYAQSQQTSVPNDTE